METRKSWSIYCSTANQSQQLTKKKTDKKKKKSEDIIEELEDEGFFKVRKYNIF